MTSNPKNTLDERKFREWWIDTYTNRHDIQDNVDEDGYYAGDALRKHPRQGPLLFQQGLVHVIEYAAIAEMQAEIDAVSGYINLVDECNIKLNQENQKLREALERIVNRTEDYATSGCIESYYYDESERGKRDLSLSDIVDETRKALEAK